MQEGLCKLSRFYSFVLRRYCEEENGAKICPQRLAGGAEAKRPTGILSWALSK